ncbi:hypothetical protein CH249_15880 [Rhodococcus sp. 05-2255-3B1]|nr:hypothetical protein CH250_23945 [Rhodococcus sp. 05-2255-3C]OZE09642.1 hypothetical protein CH249_15880 [Rhodococcus sp. 05-2255-3B1]OZE14909.1 hypothetical protein CH255_22225 [Rhodococcus sp. 05-2255-2A2]
MPDSCRRSTGAGAARRTGGSSTHGWAAVTDAMQGVLSFEAETVGSCCGDRDGCEVRLIVRRSTYQSRR